MVKKRENKIKNLRTNFFAFEFRRKKRENLLRDNAMERQRERELEKRFQNRDSRWEFYINIALVLITDK